MLQLLPQNKTLIPDTCNPEEAVKYINKFIETTRCEKMSVDISFMNILDACYVSTMCSALHYVKYPEGKINWKISSEIIREFNKDMELGNSEYTFCDK